MKDCFNLNEINKNLLELVSSVKPISEACEEYVKTPSDITGQIIVEKIEISQKNMSKVKDGIVKMINVIDGTSDVIEIEESDNGVILKN